MAAGFNMGGPAGLEDLAQAPDRVLLPLLSCVGKQF